ncbi:DUF4013 domain-containing protein [archaeon]|nr:DUF4013 domain-containing protein [archaeon]
MVDYEKAFKRPFTDFSKLLIGVLILFIPMIFLVVPNPIVITIATIIVVIASLILGGYQLECARTTIKNKFKLPEWGNFFHLFSKGFLAMIIGIIYMLPALIIGYIFLAKPLSEIIPNIENISSEAILQILSANLTSIVIGGIILTLYFILFTYVSPMITLFFAQNYKFKQSFQIKKIFRKAFTGKYFVAILLAFIYSMALSLVFSGLFTLILTLLVKNEAIVSIFSSLMSSVLGFVLAVTVYTIYGSVFKELKNRR